MNQSQNLKKYIFIIVITTLIVIVGVVIFNNITRSGKLPVALYMAPDDSTLIIDDVKHKPSNKIYLSAGDHEIKATRDGFSDYQSTITVQDDTDNVIVIALISNSSEGDKWLADNPNQVLDIESKAGELAIKSGIELSENNPIIDILPIQNSTYSIGYKLNPDDETGKSIIVTIDTREFYRQSSISSLREEEVVLSDYQYEFTNWEDPFK